MEIRLDNKAIDSLLSRTTEASAHRAAGRVRDRAKSNAPKGSGKLGNSITARKTSGSGPTAVYSVGSDLPYAKYQEEGTGPIVPVRAKVLRFKAGGKFVFARRTRGVPATHFLKRAYQTLTAKDFLP